MSVQWKMFPRVLVNPLRVERHLALAAQVEHRLVIQGAVVQHQVRHLAVAPVPLPLPHLEGLVRVLHPAPLARQRIRGL